MPATDRGHILGTRSVTIGGHWRGNKGYTIANNTYDEIAHVNSLYILCPFKNLIFLELY